jgi:Lon protease-like protein
MINAALFPIPRSVAFPGVPYPLHVFEPRYRQMVRYCVDEGVLMGVCHTEKVVHANERQQTVQEALNSNQSTYKPRDIFSAGPVTLLEELADGRMLISVEIEQRLALHEEVQTLPFGIWSCEPLPDEPADEQAQLTMNQCREKILQRLLTITHDQPEMQTHLRSEHWQNMPAQAFSFAIAGSIGMDAELAQHLLETTDTLYRLETLLKLINHIA